MLKISKLTDYATWIIHSLSQQTASPRSALQISTEIKLPLPTVSKILKSMTQAGLIKSARGVEGGYCLDKDLREISLRQLMDAIEGPFALTACNKENHVCGKEGICYLRHSWRIVHEKVRALLEGITIAEMIAPTNCQQPIEKKVS